MPPLLPSSDQQTKRFGGAHVCLVWSKYRQQDLCKKSRIKTREEQPQNQKGSLLTSHPIINLDTASFHLNMIGDVTEYKPMGGLQHHLKWTPTIESPSKSILNSPATCPLGHRHLAEPSKWPPFDSSFLTRQLMSIWLATCLFF
jgi:hypothetical protein